MKIIEQLLNLVFPPRPTEALIQNAIRKSLKLSKQSGQYESIYFLTHYEDKLVAAAIRENKFFNNLDAAKLLAELLEANLSKYKNSVVIIPVPLSKKRWRERGHNQVETIAMRTTAKVRTDLLERIKHSAPQTSLDRSSRLKNITGAFVCKKPEGLMYLENTTFILLDDVITTGATIKSAQVVLEPIIHPSSTLICLAIAH
jgi:ComF family protein